MKIYTSRQIRAAEAESVRLGVNFAALMENAGRAAADIFCEWYQLQGKRITVVCGKGNNGGDGFVAARLLAERGMHPCAVLLCGFPSTYEAFTAYEKARRAGVPILDAAKQEEECARRIGEADYIIDAVFGFGFGGMVREPLAGWLRRVNEARAIRISLDVPSGTSCDSASVGGTAVQADLTIAFTAPKPGHFLFPAADCCGEVVTADVGLPAEALAGLESSVFLTQKKDISFAFQKRRKNTNKGSYGKLLAACGSKGMAGASILACKAAMRCGVGLVQLATPGSNYLAAAGNLIETVLVPAPETEEGTFAGEAGPFIVARMPSCSAVLFGCGVGSGPELDEVLAQILESARVPVVLDADGINVLARNIHVVRNANVPVILTPHPGEMSTLTGLSIEEIQKNRLETAVSFSKEHGVILVLKGANTIVADPQGKAYINPTGNPGMSKGGSGDVLAGMLASFIAQGIEPVLAARAAVYVHGLAGDRCAAEKSQHGMTPTDMIDELPEVLREFE